MKSPQQGETTMRAAEFEKSLRAWLGREPFEPFVIEQEVGGQILVTNPKAVGSLGGDDAIYFGPDRQDFQFIDCDNVKRIVAAAPAGTV
jgi:hypothetical protein